MTSTLPTKRLLVWPVRTTLPPEIVTVTRYSQDNAYVVGKNFGMWVKQRLLEFICQCQERNCHMEGGIESDCLRPATHLVYFRSPDGAAQWEVCRDCMNNIAGSDDAVYGGEL